MDTSLVESEDCGSVAIVTFKPRESFFAADGLVMAAFWSALDDLNLQQKKVVLFQMPDGFMSPNLVDEFWRKVREAPIDHAPRGGRARPLMLATADNSIRRSLSFLHSNPALNIAAFGGEVDFDLMGVLLACDYRICSENTTFVNRTLQRNLGTGGGTPWFLVRLVGLAAAVGRRGVFT